MTLTVHVNGVASEEPLSAANVERAVRLVAESEGVEAGEISVTFVDARRIAELNASFLDHEGPTDVLSFNLESEREPLGDIYICPAVAHENAQDLGIPYREELVRLVVHGVLHLFGYEHPEGPDRERSEMYRRQESILARLS